MANLKIRLEKELDNDSIRIWDVELEDGSYAIEYGLEDGAMRDAGKTYETGKAGRTAEQEALKDVYKRVSDKINDDYEVVKGSYDKLESAYEKMIDAVAKAKSDVKAEKEAEKARVKAEKEADEPTDDTDEGYEDWDEDEDDENSEDIVDEDDDDEEIAASTPTESSPETESGTPDMSASAKGIESLEAKMRSFTS